MLLQVLSVKLAVKSSVLKPLMALTVDVTVQAGGAAHVHVAAQPAA